MTARVEIWREGEWRFKDRGGLRYYYPVIRHLEHRYLGDISFGNGVVDRGEIPGLNRLDTREGHTNVSIDTGKISVDLEMGRPFSKNEYLKEPEILKLDSEAIGLSVLGSFIAWRAMGKSNEYHVKVVNLKDRVNVRNGYPTVEQLGYKLDMLLWEKEGYALAKEINRMDAWDLKRVTDDLEMWVYHREKSVREDILKQSEKELENMDKVLRFLDKHSGKGTNLSNFQFSGPFDESCFLATASGWVIPRRMTLKQIKKEVEKFLDKK